MEEGAVTPGLPGDCDPRTCCRQELFLGCGNNQREAFVDVAAVAAQPVRKFGLAALGAAVDLHAGEGVMSAAGALARLGGFMEWKHESTFVIRWAKKPGSDAANPSAAF
jgi:hypothetical protein